LISIWILLDDTGISELLSWPDRADGQNARAKKIEHLKTKKLPKKKIEKREKTKNKKTKSKLINQKKTMAVNQAIRSIGTERGRHTQKKKEKRTGQDR
jgi:hypothetical protein